MYMYARTREFSESSAIHVPSGTLFRDSANLNLSLQALNWDTDWILKFTSDHQEINAFMSFRHYSFEYQYFCNIEKVYYIGLAKRKAFFEHRRAANTQIRLRIRAVWSEFSLSSYRVIVFINECIHEAQIMIRPCLCENQPILRMREELFL